jgi:uncharacterized protein YhfF
MVIKQQDICGKVMDTVDESAIEMWKEYLGSIGESVTSKAYTAWQFGLTREDADELAGLVLQGRKKATAGLACEYEYEGIPLPKKGDFSIVLGGDGKAKCIIRTTSVQVTPFTEVTEEFAWKEGEDDRSLKSWRDIHCRFFSRECEASGIKFSTDMLVVCEEFEVVFQ